ncbi:hypothetical protein CYMTET_46655 [Cymbomonas tetramitiformis]|uniref:Nudix hydrolase domain-containing protein n=1 Tax=Cymbomonas tetramitiformis TaxID=36881 RepID=A0AAE0BVV2_9CHLO|nr:hypothetical protein CYMTET_46655 [Cymbomonas tetramitiformis]
MRSASSPPQDTCEARSSSKPQSSYILENLKENLRKEHLAINSERHPLTVQGVDLKGTAAVLVPLFVGNAPADLSVLLTKRSSTLKHHKGEVCLPGGKRDPDDVDDVSTALREAQEEIGLQSHSVRVLGKLPPMLSKHQISVHPIVGTISSDFIHTGLKVNPAEVDAVFCVPLSRFLCSENYTGYMDTKFGEKLVRIHHFECDGYHVWGLTAHILIQVAKIALGQETEFEEYAAGNPTSKL